MPATSEGFRMLSIAGNARILLFREPVDLRKGFESLSSEVEAVYGNQLTSGAYFIFLNTRRNLIKVLYWDSDGLVIWNKRLEKGTFSKAHLNKQVMNRRDFFMMLEGIIPKRVQHRHIIS
jgi:transposase